MINRKLSDKQHNSRGGGGGGTGGASGGGGTVNLRNKTFSSKSPLKHFKSKNKTHPSLVNPRQQQAQHKSIQKTKTNENRNIIINNNNNINNSINNNNEISHQQHHHQQPQPQPPQLQSLNQHQQNNSNNPRTVSKKSLGKVGELLAQKNYIVLKFVDRGSTSQVFKVQRNDQIFAAKVIDHSKISSMIRQRFLPNELSIVQKIKHPFIIETEEVIEHDEYSIIITEFATDGDLITYIEHLQQPDFAKAKRWICQITQALVYLHHEGIAHRDIKADNVLLCRGVAKLSDFTYSLYSIDPNTKSVIPCTTFCGTVEYKAPETLLCDTPFDPFIADCFSMGVLIYTLVTLEFPFGTGPVFRTSAGIRQLHSDIMGKKWTPNEELSKDRRLCSLLRQLLNPDIDERITAPQILYHPWFNDL